MTEIKKLSHGGILSAAAFLLLLSGCGNRSEPAATAPPTANAPSAAAGAPAGAPAANTGGMQQVRPGMAGVPK